MPDLTAKRERLLAILREMPRAVVAFSGGVDSTVVAQAAFFAMRERAVAVTSDSPSVPRAELAGAVEIARRIGILHRIVQTEEFENPDYLRNDGSRCYYCKDELYSEIEKLLPEFQPAVVCSGANLDDLGDYRPGLTAAAEHRVRHPLQEAGFTKGDVRELAREWGLPTWDKPASPCLSSRLVPGLPVTRERTAMVEAAEACLRALGLRECRVRLHEGELARIEVPANEVSRLASLEVRGELSRQFREIGFRFVTLDLEGFRSGSMNDLVSLEIRQQYQSEFHP